MPVLIHAVLPTQESLPKGAIVFDLDEILEALRPAGDQLNWFIHDVWALTGGGQVFVGIGPSRQVALDNATLDLACGDISGRMSFSQLRALATSTRQTIRGVFIGCAMGEESPDANPALIEERCVTPEETWYRDYSAVVHACDGWRIYARDEEFSSRLRSVLPLQTTVLAKW
jgi:hypothetical protein